MGLSIKFTNYSPTTWTRSVNGSSIDAVLQNLTQSPGPTLQAHSGSEGIAAEQSMLSFIATGDINLYCCWFDPASGQRFGVQLIAPVQVLDMGYAPYWQVMADQGPIGADPSWQSSGDDPSNPYIWSGVTGFSIRATPTAGHSDLDIEVVVQAQS